MPFDSHFFLLSLSGLSDQIRDQTALRKMKEKQTLIVGAGLQLFLRKWGEVLLSVWIGGRPFFGWSSHDFGRSQFKHINPVHLQPCWSKWLSFMTWPVTRPRIIRSSHPVVDIPFPLVVGARSILIWMGPRYIWPALRVSRWYKQRKDEFQSHPLSLKANPYQRRKSKKIILSPRQSSCTSF